VRRRLGLVVALLVGLVPVAFAQINVSSPIPVVPAATTNRLGSVRPVDSADADLTSTKGTQTTRAVGVQQFKDAGRSRVTFTADAVTPATSETLVTFVKDVAGTATTAQTTYSVTAGKTFRVQALHVYYALTSTTLSEVRVALRENTGGACTAASTLAVRLGAGVPATTATSVNHEAGTQADFTIPDGLEFPAADSLCLSAIATSASSAVTITLVGYEY
jgi:hypothetical protein